MNTEGFIWFASLLKTADKEWIGIPEGLQDKAFTQLCWAFRASQQPLRPSPCLEVNGFVRRGQFCQRTTTKQGISNLRQGIKTHSQLDATTL